MNSAPPANVMRKYTNRGLFNLSWHDRLSAIPTAPMSVNRADACKYCGSLNHVLAMASMMMSIIMTATCSQASMFCLFITVRF